MIQTREDLNFYLKQDGVPDTRTIMRKIYGFVFRDETYYIRRYLKILRYLEYFMNNRTASAGNNIKYHYCQR